MQTIFNFEFRFDKNKENKSKIEKTFLIVIKNSQPIVRMAIGLRGLERKSPIIGSQASLQPANILFPLNRDP